MEALSMAAADFEPPGDRDPGRMGQSSRGADTAPLVQMVNNRLGFGFTHFGVEQGGAPSFREFFMATSAAQQTHTIFAIDLTHGESDLAWAPNLLAIGMDTG
jgi:hypothetical protein